MALDAVEFILIEKMCFVQNLKAVYKPPSRLTTNDIEFF